MSDREYGVWVFNPRADAEPRVIPAASSRYWADRKATEHAEAEGTTVKVVYRYTFMPGMPWEDA